MSKLPSAVVVKVDYDLDRSNLFNSSSYDVHIVDRAKLDVLKLGIGRNKFNGIVVSAFFAGINGYVLIYRSVITHLITSGELNSMFSVSKICFNRNDSVRERNLYLNSIDIRPNRAFIKTGEVVLAGILLYSCSECNLVGSNGLTVQDSCISHVRGRVSNVGEHGSFTIINRAGIINGNVVNINRKFSGDITILSCIVIVRRTVTVGNVKLDHSTVCRPTYCIVCRNISIEIMPTGFAEGGNYTGSAHCSVHSIRVNATSENGVSVFIESNRSESPSSPKTNKFIGNIDPNAHAYCVFEYSILGGIYTCLHIARLKGISIVYYCSQRIVSTMRLGVGNEVIGFRPNVVILGTGSFIDDNALVGSVFKVINDLRTFTESYRSYSNKIAVLEACGQATACCRLAFISCGELKSADSTYRIIREGECEVRGFNVNRFSAVSSGYVQLDRLSEGNYNLAARKADRIGKNHVDDNLTDNLAVINHSYQSLTYLTVGGENAVLNSTEGIICHIPLNISGDFCCTTGLINTESRDRNGASGSNVLILCSQGSVYEYTVGYSGRNHNEAVRNRTLGTVRGAVHDVEIIGTLCLCCICTRSTTIKVSCPYTTKVKHYLSLLKNGKTNRLRSLVTVCSHKNYFSISGDTDSLTRIISILIKACANFAINDKHSVNAYCLLNIALVIRIVALVTDLNRTVLHNCEVTVAVTFRFGSYVDAIHNECTGRLTCYHVVVGSIDAGYYSSLVIGIARSSFFVKCCNLLGQL